MSLWKKTNDANSAPKYQVLESANAAVHTGKALFDNTTVNNAKTGTHHNNQVIGVFGASNSDTKTSKKLAAAGWQLLRQTTGGVQGVTVTAQGTGYANTDTVSVSGGTTAATGKITTDGSGKVTAVTMTSGGAGYTGANVSVSVTTSGGNGATFSAQLNPSAGRTRYETLVAMHGMPNSPKTLP